MALVSLDRPPRVFCPSCHGGSAGTALRPRNSIQRNVQTGALGNNATAVANFDRPIALFEAIGQRSIIFHAQPKPQQMTFLACNGPIAESGPIMQQCVIVDELHVTGLELHSKMQTGIVRERIEQVQRFDTS